MIKSSWTWFRQPTHSISPEHWNWYQQRKTVLISQQTRETKAYYIATDAAVRKYHRNVPRNISEYWVAHKGIVELFVDLDQQVDVVSDYLWQLKAKAMLTKLKLSMKNQ